MALDIVDMHKVFHKNLSNEIIYDWNIYRQIQMFIYWTLWIVSVVILISSLTLAKIKIPDTSRNPMYVVINLIIYAFAAAYNLLRTA